LDILWKYHKFRRKHIKAVTYQGIKNMQVKNVPDPALVKDDDIIVRITSSLMAQKFAWMQGAKRVIAVDCVPYRLEKAKQMNKKEV
jgi:threonine dehydrogenase-like Zn-dependent dehydrogenase